MGPLTQGVTIVVTPCARFYGLGVRLGVPLAELADQAARREAKRPSAAVAAGESR